MNEEKKTKDLWFDKNYYHKDGTQTKKPGIYPIIALFALRHQVGAQ